MKHRPIEEVIKELENHPDCVYLKVWTKREVMDLLPTNSVDLMGVEIDFNNYPVKIKDWLYQQEDLIDWSRVYSRIDNFYSFYLNNAEFDPLDNIELEDLRKEFKRRWELDYLTP